MATYAVGDIQGCFAALQALLQHIQFDSQQDTLWLTGDLVNRGPDSLGVLRFLKSLEKKHRIILGNHDLHLLAVYFSHRAMHETDTLQAVLAAPDAKELMDWLRFQPLFHWDEKLNFAMVHAGLAPTWSMSLAAALSKEVEAVLQSDHPDVLLSQMYGNEPDQWREDLSGIDRLRCIINYFTRLRFCDQSGKMDFKFKGKIAQKPSNLIPWYECPHRLNQHINIVFGHWAALEGRASVATVFPLDTGCVWGGCLTAMRLEDKQKFNIQC